MSNEEKEFEEEFARLSRERAGEKEEVKEPVEKEPIETVAEPEVEQEVAAEHQEEEQRAADPLADVPDDIKTLVSQLQEQNAKLSHEYKSVINRLNPKQKENEQLRRQLRELHAQVQSSRASHPEAQEKWKEFKEEWPDIAEYVETRLSGAQQKGPDTEIKAKLAQLEEAEQRRYVEGQYAALAAAHPDFQDIATSADFTLWVSQQPGAVQGYLTSYDAGEVSWLLSAYKRDKGIGAKLSGDVAAIQQKRSEQLRSGRSVSSRQVAPAQGGAEDFESAFRFFSKKREQRAPAR